MESPGNSRQSSQSQYLNPLLALKLWQDRERVKDLLSRAAAILSQSEAGRAILAEIEAYAAPYLPSSPKN
jgi:hypothetical protein